MLRTNNVRSNYKSPLVDSTKSARVELDLYVLEQQFSNATKSQ